MPFRCLVFSLVFLLGGLVSCLAQQSTGPATLENLLKDEPAAPTKRPVAVDATDPTVAPDSPAGLIQGAVSPPKDRIQHPDLDAAWAKYEAQIDVLAKAIELAIETELNAAAASGDLDAALKWKTAGEQFKKQGRIPEGLYGGTAKGRPTPKPPRTDALPPLQITEANNRLASAYAAVEKRLVNAHDLEKARQVRAEIAGVFSRPKPSAKKFLTHLPHRGFNAGPERAFSKNGITNEGHPLSVRGVRVPHALWLHPPTNGFSRVTFDVPDGASKIAGAVAMNDSTQDQRTPLTFAILDERDNILWSSRPIKGRGAEQAFDVPLGKAKAVTLKVLCPGDWRFAHAVWVDPYFLVQ